MLRELVEREREELAGLAVPEEEEYWELDIWGKVVVDVEGMGCGELTRNWIWALM